MKKNKNVLFLLTVFIGLLVACSNNSGVSKTSDGNSGTVSLKLAHTQADTHPVHTSMEEFANLVEEKTNGEVVIEIFPNGQLGDERQLIESIQSGAIEMTKVSSNSLENFEEIYSIFSIPYFFDDMEHGRNFMNSSNTESLFKSTTGLDLLGITWYDAGVRNYYTKNKSIEKPEDLKGLTMRVLSSEVLIETVETLGGSATPLDWGELYTAIQQGVVNGADSGVVPFTESNLGEVAKHFSFTEHVFSPDILIIKNTLFEGLSNEHQQAILSAAEESTAFHNETWEQERQDAIKASEDMGVTFYYPDLEPFAEVLNPIKEKYVSDNEKIADMLDLVEKVK